MKTDVEILYFEDCPHYRDTAATVRRLVDELGVEADVRLVNVPDSDAAERLRFLGSPTVRIAGRDIEWGAEERTDYALGCRVSKAATGFAGLPDERWIRDARAEDGSAG